MVKYLFLDLDDTILDFRKAEQVAIRKTLAFFGVDPTPEVCTRYSYINKLHWEALERRELTREQVLTGRFDVLFKELGLEADSGECAVCYTKNLGQGHYFLPGAEEALKQLSKKYLLYLVSNGNTYVQKSRLESAKIAPYFQNIFISQEMGATKPSKEYFQRCFEKIDAFDPGCAMIVGDSLTSDILGGKNAGIATCWVNPTHKNANPDIIPDYEIESIAQLEALLQTL